MLEVTEWRRCDTVWIVIVRERLFVEGTDLSRVRKEFMLTDDVACNSTYTMSF